VAVALAAAWAWNHRGQPAPDARARLLDFVLTHTPPGETRAMLARACSLPADASVQLAASALGTGQHVLSADTVPFAIWCAGGHLTTFVEAMWATVAGLGDRDTTCAIAGSIVALSAGDAAIPHEWLRSTERIPPPWPVPAA
jgi:ADP-ribosylglycohydrolase